jgi:dCTP deaminase
MLLSDLTIANLAYDQCMIDPFFAEKKLHEESGLSYGLQPASYDFRIRETIILHPKDYALVSTLESVRIPYDVGAAVADKSSWARRFVSVGNTHFDPGFRGYPTIEITNHSRDTIEIISGTPICQFKFFKMDREAMRPYSGKYQDQPPEPVRFIRESAR